VYSIAGPLAVFDFVSRTSEGDVLSMIGNTLFIFRGYFGTQGPEKTSDLCVVEQKDRSHSERACARECTLSHVC
jgi:hypothetical protein